MGEGIPETVPVNPEETRGGEKPGDWKVAFQDWKEEFQKWKDIYGKGSEAE